MFQFVLLVLLSLLHWHAALQLQALLFHHLQLVLRLPELCLVRVVGLHGGVQLVQDLQNLLMDLVADLAALQIISTLSTHGYKMT